MAIDDNYIYITGPAISTYNGDNNIPINCIIKIPKTLIAQKVQYASDNRIESDAIINIDLSNTNQTNGCKVLRLFVTNPNPAERENTPYVSYHGFIRNITCKLISGGVARFIVNYQIPGTTLDNDVRNDTLYTRAKVMSDPNVNNGEEFLYISQSNSVVFMIKNTLAETSYINADICYSQACGLFAPKFYTTPTDGRKTKNVILWADIDGEEDEEVTINGKIYKCYIPVKINANVKNVVNSSVSSTIKMYKKFEIESMDFDGDNDLLFTTNIEYTDEYKTAYYNLYGSNPAADAVFELKRTGGLGWTLADRPS